MEIQTRERPRASLQQTCKACGQPDKFDFHVPDKIWQAVIPQRLQTRAVCFYCFDEYARENNVNYAPHISKLYFAGRGGFFEFRVVIALSGID